MEMAVEYISCEMGYFNEKYYKTGLADGIRVVMECMQRGRQTGMMKLTYLRICDII